MLVVLGCLVALIGWQALINHIYPPRPKALKVATALAGTNAVPQAATIDESVNR